MHFANNGNEFRRFAKSLAPQAVKSLFERKLIPSGDPVSDKHILDQAFLELVQQISYRCLCLSWRIA
jgi:hypothetical protein